MKWSVFLVVLGVLAASPADVITISNFFDGFEWQNISVIKVKAELHLRGNAEFTADRIIISAPIFTEGKSLSVRTKDLQFEGGGAIFGYSSAVKEVPPKPPAPEKAKHGEDNPSDLTEDQPHIVYSASGAYRDGISIRLTEEEFNHLIPIFATLLLPVHKFVGEQFVGPATSMGPTFAEGDLANARQIVGKDLADRLSKKSPQFLKGSKPEGFQNLLSAVVLEKYFSKEKISPKDFSSHISLQRRVVVIKTRDQLMKGEDGRQGQSGKNGFSGEQFPGEIQILAEVIRGHLKIDGTGQKGGRGGPGQDGQAGGDGGKGAPADIGFLGIDESDGGPGGPGGKGGDGGPGGRGGRGGAAIPVIIRYDHTGALLDEKKEKEFGWAVVSEDGEGGDPGESGRSGNPGRGGPGGDSAKWLWANPDAGKTGPAGAEGKLWKPSVAELASLTGVRDINRKPLQTLQTKTELLEIKRKIINNIFSLQLERNRSLLMTRTFGFLFDLKNMSKRDLGLQIRSELTQKSPGLVYSALESDRQELLKHWHEHLRFLDLTIPGFDNSAESLKRNFEFKDISSKWVSWLEALSSESFQKPVADGTENGIQNLLARIERNLDNLSFQLEIFCADYKAHAEAEWMDFRLPVCTDQSWKENPNAVFRFSAPLPLSSPTNDAIETGWTKLQLEDLLPQQVRDLFQVSGLRLGGAAFAENEAIVFSFSSLYRQIANPTFDVHEMAGDGPLRGSMAVSALAPIPLEKIQKPHQIRGHLVILAVQARAFAESLAKGVAK